MRILIRQIKESKLGLLLLAVLLPTLLISFLLKIQLSEYNQQKLKLEKQIRGVLATRELFDILREAKNIMVNKEGSFYANTQSLTVNLTVSDKRWEGLKTKIISEKYLDQTKDISQTEEAQKIFKIQLKDFFDLRPKDESVLTRVTSFFMDHSEIRSDSKLDSFYLAEGILFQYSYLMSSFLYTNSAALDSTQKQKIIDQIEEISNSILKTKNYQSLFSLSNAETQVILLQLEILKTYVNGAFPAKNSKELFLYSQKIEESQNQIITIYEKKKNYFTEKNNELILLISIFYTLFLIVIFSLMKHLDLGQTQVSFENWVSRTINLFRSLKSKQVAPAEKNDDLSKKAS